MKGSTRIRIGGMHCPACVALVEREFAKVSGVASAKADLKSGTAVVEWDGEAEPELSAYRVAVESFGYTVEGEGAPAAEPSSERRTLGAELRSWAIAAAIACLLVAGYYGVQMAGFSSESASRSEATIAAAFLSGLAASVSSCLALVGSLVLALGAYGSGTGGRFASLRRNAFFQAGRVGGFFLLGGALGALGGALAFSTRAAGAATLAGGLAALVLGVGLLLPRAGGASLFRLPAFLSRFLDAVAASANPAAPLLLGASTFFLPCGFALSMQALSLASGSFMGGALIMGAFALGTAPVLTAAGLAGAWTRRSGPALTRAAGLAVVAFALISVSSGLSLFGSGGASGLVAAAGESAAAAGKAGAAGRNAAAAGEIQRVVMRVGAYSFEPAEIRVKAGVPVEWVIVGENPSGCTNRIIVPGTDLSIPVRKGESRTVSFTASEKGVIRFSCWMAMVHGRIVVE